MTRVAVLYGGISAESEVSRSTGVQVIPALREAGFEVTPIEVDEDIIQIRIEASHFLWRMVRRVIGTLVKVGKGEVSLEEFRRLIDGKCDARLDVAAWTAPASGLFLEEVRY